MMTMGLDSTGIVGKETNNGTANAISTDLLPEDEWLNDIENTDPSSVLGCGVFKCAFRSVTTTTTTTTTMTGSPPPRGYLVTMELRPPDKTKPGEDNDLEEARRTFAIAEDLSRGWSVRHALLAPPVRLFGSEGPLSSSSSSSLSSSSSSSSSSRQQQQQQQQQKKKKLFETMYNSTKAVMLNAKAEWLESSSSAGGGSILVQPIALYSPDGVLFKCSDEYQKWALEAVANLTASSFGLVVPAPEDDNDGGFASRLRGDLGVTVAAMETSPHGPCLSKDFQVVLDPVGGTIVHIDLDRCFGTMMVKRWGPGCRAMLETLVETMIDRRETVLLEHRAAAAASASAS